MGSKTTSTKLKYHFWRSDNKLIGDKKKIKISIVIRRLRSEVHSSRTTKEVSNKSKEIFFFIDMALTSFNIVKINYITEKY